jgi:hypothetical protein
MHAGEEPRGAGQAIPAARVRLLKGTLCESSSGTSVADTDRESKGVGRESGESDAQASTSSVIQTCKRRAANALDVLSQAFRGFTLSLFHPAKPENR